MSTTCPQCHSANIQRTAPGALLDDFRCRDCGTAWERISPTARQVALIGAFTLLTGGLDGGAIGSAVASFLGGSGDS